MCINPVLIPSGQTIACRKCWQCTERKIDDWVGRNIAEAKTSAKTHSVTLTYGRDENDNPDHLHAAILTYSDVQKYFKKLRKNGFPCRYFAVGEYGTLKGRSHWHIIIHWQEKVPEIILNERFKEKHWDHGTSFFEEIHENSVRYVCKYLHSEEKIQSHLAMSKKPPLGDKYFRWLAAEYVQQGIAPQDFGYQFPEILAKKGKPKKFWMGKTTATNFMKYFTEEWYKQRPREWLPESEIVDAYLDSLVGEQYEVIAGKTWTEIQHLHNIRKRNVKVLKIQEVILAIFSGQDEDYKHWFSTLEEFVNFSRYNGDLEHDSKLIERFKKYHDNNAAN